MSAGNKPESADQPRGFAVSDRRSFTETGESRAADEAAAPAPTDASAASAAPADTPPAAEARPAAEPKARSRRLPPVDFPTFVLSLGSSALMHLGEAPHPGSDETVKDLEMAKHTIDILSMLEQKTKGNLNASEAQLMENLLFDLRLRYVEAAKK
jgi:Domain of unknown function (DUF1844)